MHLSSASWELLLPYMHIFTTHPEIPYISQQNVCFSIPPPPPKAALGEKSKVKKNGQEQISHRPWPFGCWSGDKMQPESDRHFLVILESHISSQSKQWTRWAIDLTLCTASSSYQDLLALIMPQANGIKHKMFHFFSLPVSVFQISNISLNVINKFLLIKSNFVS